MRTDYGRYVLARSLAVGSVFALFKLVFVLRAEAAADSSVLILLPWLCSTDFLVGMLIGLSACLLGRNERLLTDLGLTYYLVNLHYLPLFGGFMGPRVFAFASGGEQLWSSLIALLDWPLIIAWAVLLIGHRLLSSTLLKLLTRKKQLQLLTTAVAVIWCVLLFPPGLHVYGQYAKNPFVEMGRQLATLPFRPAEDLSGIEPGSFDARSPYSGDVEEPLVLVGEPKKHTNVIVVLMESTSNRSIALEQGTAMPELEKLRHEGVSWTSFYAPMPLSMKSIFAIHTGHYPAATLTPITRFRPRIPIRTLPDYFKRSGYRTAFLAGGKFSYYNKRAFLKDRGYDVMLDAETLPNRTQFEQSSWGLDDKAEFEYAKQWIASSEEPFLLFLLPLSPHHPYDTPSKWSGPHDTSSERGRYHNAVAYIDSLIGDLVAFLKARSIDDETLLVVTADHGEAFGEHRNNRLHTGAIYEENVNVPLVMVQKGVLPPGQTIDTPHSMEDILPTILDLVNIPPSNFKGDGLSLVQGGRSELVFLSTHLQHDILGLRDGSLKFILNTSDNSVQMFDLSEDPSEKEDISGPNGDRILTYTDLVLRWSKYSRAALLAPF